MGIVIKGTGMYVPDRILTNADLEKMVETSDEWITTRTGIKERHIADREIMYRYTLFIQSRSLFLQYLLCLIFS